MATMIIRARRDIILYKNVIMLGIALHVFWVARYLAWLLLKLHQSGMTVFSVLTHCACRLRLATTSASHGKTVFASYIQNQKI